MILSSRLIIRFSALAVVALSSIVHATEVPPYMNFQSVLRDDSGNLTEDGFMDLQMKILDQDKDVVYEETQPGVQVLRSAINVMIGEGVVPGSSPSTPTGGIPASALDPEKGSHFLQVQFGSNLPSDPMELGSVPYAMYAERALGLAPTTLPENLPDYLVTQDELNAAIQIHENDTTAHPASSITVNGAFTTVTGSTVQQVLQSIDSIISNINNIPGILSNAKIESSIARDSEVSSAVSTEASARSSADAGLQSQINTLNTTVSSLASRITDLESAPTIVYAADINNVTGATEWEYESPKVGNVTVIKSSTGLYTVTFGTPLLTTNYIVVGSGEEDGPSEGVVMAVTEDSKSTSGFGFRTVNMSDTHTDTRTSIAVILKP